MPLKNKPCNACYLSLYYIYRYIKISLMKVSRPKNKYSICAPMVFMYSFGSVWFGVGLKGKEGHALGPSKNKQTNIYYFYIFYYTYDSSPDEVLPTTNSLSVPPHGVHLYFGLGTVWGWIKGIGRPPLLECTEVPLKNKLSNACFLSI